MPDAPALHGRESLAGSSSLHVSQHLIVSLDSTMYVITPCESIYHLAADNHFVTLCGLGVDPPYHQKRCTDRRLSAELPAKRVMGLCSQCASLSGDTRDFSERIIYPSTSVS